MVSYVITPCRPSNCKKQIYKYTPLKNTLKKATFLEFFQEKIFIFLLQSTINKDILTVKTLQLSPFFLTKQKLQLRFGPQNYNYWNLGLYPEYITGLGLYLNGPWPAMETGERPFIYDWAQVYFVLNLFLRKMLRAGKKGTQKCNKEKELLITN
jgi:hypothetical protein